MDSFALSLMMMHKRNALSFQYDMQCGWGWLDVEISRKLFEVLGSDPLTNVFKLRAQEQCYIHSLILSQADHDFDYCDPVLNFSGKLEKSNEIPEVVAIYRSRYNDCYGSAYKS